MTLAQIDRMKANLNGHGNRSELGQAAEAYARRGWRVFPLAPRTKSGQLLQSWKSEASADVERVRQWWKRWPDANIGIACGPSRLLVVDLDGEEGREAWERLAKDHGISPSPLVSVTGSGGRHLVYALPEGVRNTIKKLGPGIDTRADGGYIVAAPSVHPNGERYTWAESAAEPAACPAALVDLLTRDPDPWKIQTLTDAFTERPPIRWLVAGVLPAEALAIVYGAPGALKSMLLADLAVCVAAGKPWLDPLPGQAVTAFAVAAAAPVLWLDIDNGARRTADRFEALARAHGVHPSAPLHYVSMPTPPFVAGDAESVRNMAARILANGYRLVIIDNLSAIKGSVDENSDGMALVMASLRQLTEATGAAIVVIHHQRKGQARTNDGQGTRDGESLRGHSSIEASIDLALLVMRENGTPNVMVKSTKDRDAGVAPFAAAFTFEHDDTGRLYAARMQQVAAIGRAEAREAEAARKIESKVLQLLKDEGPLTAKAIEDGVTGQRTAVRQVVAALRLAGKITVTDGQRGAKIHALRPQ